MSAATATPGLRMNHTMLRIKDPKITIPFYEKNFGFKVVKVLKAPLFKFDNYFLAYAGHNSLDGPDAAWYDREGVLELCHNYGVENDDSYKLNNGNAEPHRGFGHICVSVDNLEAACSRLEANGVKFQKKLTDGRQKNIAFALDPNGYWIEIVKNPQIEATGTTTDVSTYRFNHSMIRVKDADKSLDFYVGQLGLKLVAKKVFEGAKFTLYFLSSSEDGEFGVTGQRQGLIELTHNWGTENDPDFKYHDGNSEPQGFGHFCVTLPTLKDVSQHLAKWKDAGITIKKGLEDGKMKGVAFILDPDGYAIEVIPRQDIGDIC